MSEYIAIALRNAIREQAGFQYVAFDEIRVADEDVFD